MLSFAPPPIGVRPVGSCIVVRAVVWLTYHGVHTTAAWQTAAQQGCSHRATAGPGTCAVRWKSSNTCPLVGAERTLSDLLRTPEDRVLVDQANRYLAFAKARTDVAAVYLIDLHGRTLAASNWESATSYGANHRFRPYFQAAIQGRTSMFYGIGVTTGTPGAFIAAPLYLGQRIAGWWLSRSISRRLRPAGEAGLQIAMADAQGIVFLATQTRLALPQPGGPYLPGAGTSARHTAIWQHCAAHLASKVGTLADGAWQTLTIDHKTYLVQTQAMGRFDWQMLLFSDPAQPAAKVFWPPKLPHCAWPWSI